jgi:hypothetical protein
VIAVSLEPRQLTAGRDQELEIRFGNTGAGTCTDIVFKLGLPPGFLLLRGRNRIEVPELGAGGSCVQKVTVRPPAPGDFAVTSANFSYRNEYGTPVRVPGFRAALTVLAGTPEQAVGPDLAVAVTSGPLAPGEWDVLQLRVQNASPAPLRGLSLLIGGPVRIAAPSPQARLPDLVAGQQAEVSFIACPTQAGSHVPAQVRVTYQDGSGRTRAQEDIIPLAVTSRPPPAAERGSTRPDTILYLAASPADMTPLRSDREMREIRERLQLGKHRDRFRLESAQAARLKDIGQALADHDPRIVHFAGHGERDGSLYLEDEMGYSVPVAPAGLAELFGLHAHTIGCVIVNACHTLALAQAIAGHISHVIAMRYEIGDAAAITFSIGFYQGLAAGAPVAQAFARGRAFLLTEAVGKPEHDTPVLLGLGGQELA